MDSMIQTNLDNAPGAGNESQIRCTGNKILTSTIATKSEG